MIFFSSSVVIFYNITELLKQSIKKVYAYVPSDKYFMIVSILLNKSKEFYVLDLQQFLKNLKLMLTIFFSMLASTFIFPKFSVAKLYFLITLKTPIIFSDYCDFSSFMFPRNNSGFMVYNIFITFVMIPCSLNNFWIEKWLYMVLPNLLSEASNPSAKSKLKDSNSIKLS